MQGSKGRVRLAVVFAWVGITAISALSGLTGCATSPLGRRQLIVVPEAQMSALGAQAFQQMKSATPTDSEPALNSYVRCVAQPITEAAREATGVKDWEIVVFKDDTANAFALPGGKIGVHTGILKVAKTADQLAAVLGHEVGHVIAKHGAERVSQSLAAQGGLAALDAALGGQSAGREQLLSGLIQVGFLLPFSRTQESEADLIGLDLMAKAGFNPRESVGLWQNMAAEAGGKSPPEWLSTHPANQARIDNLQKHMPQAVVTFNQVKSNGRSPHCSR